MTGTTTNITNVNEFKSLPTAGLIIIENKKLLLAFSKNKNAYYLPGGKIDDGESSEQALIREIKEELNIDLDESKLQKYHHITALAYGESPPLRMEQDCYLYTLQDHQKPIQPSNEISDVQYFNLKEYQNQPVQVEGVIIAFNLLIKDGYL
eukprot:gene4140-5180_t